jgi:hypothetical protein
MEAMRVLKAAHSAANDSRCVSGGEVFMGGVLGYSISRFGVLRQREQLD